VFQILSSDKLKYSVNRKFFARAGFQVFRRSAEMKKIKSPEDFIFFFFACYEENRFARCPHIVSFPAGISGFQSQSQACGFAEYTATVTGILCTFFIRRLAGISVT